jgi:hypothetical protein
LIGINTILKKELISYFELFFKICKGDELREYKYNEIYKIVKTKIIEKEVIDETIIDDEAKFYMQNQRRGYINYITNMIIDAFNSRMESISYPLGEYNSLQEFYIANPYKCPIDIKGILVFENDALKLKGGKITNQPQKITKFGGSKTKIAIYLKNKLLKQLINKIKSNI